MRATSPDPATLTTDQRFAQLAALLALGARRWAHKATRSPDSTSFSPDLYAGGLEFLGDSRPYGVGVDAPYEKESAR